MIYDNETQFNNGLELIAEKRPGDLCGLLVSLMILMMISSKKTSGFYYQKLRHAVSKLSDNTGDTIRSAIEEYNHCVVQLEKKTPNRSVFCVIDFLESTKKLSKYQVDCVQCLDILIDWDKEMVFNCDKHKGIALNCAIRIRNREIIKTLLDRGIYMLDRSVIENLDPKVLEEHFDSCISKYKNYIEIDFKNFINQSAERQDDMQCINFMADSHDHNHLIVHPLISLLVMLKWNHYAKIICSRFILCLILMKATIMYALKIGSHLTTPMALHALHDVGSIALYCYIFLFIWLMLVFCILFIIARLRPFVHAYRNNVKITVVVIAISMFIVSLVAVFVSGLWVSFLISYFCVYTVYVARFLNNTYTKIASYTPWVSSRSVMDYPNIIQNSIQSISMLLFFLSESLDSYLNQKILGTIAILSTANATFLSAGSTFWNFSQYYVMFWDVTLSSLKSLQLCLIFLPAFATSFFLMVFDGEYSSGSNSQSANSTCQTDGLCEQQNATSDKDTSPFHQFSSSILKVIIMSTGEFDVADTRFDLNMMTLCLFLSFVFLISIVFMNLMNGLAVGDTQRIQSNAELVCMQNRCKILAQLRGASAKEILLNLVNQVKDSDEDSIESFVSVSTLHTKIYVSMSRRIMIAKYRFKGTLNYYGNPLNDINLFKVNSYDDTDAYIPISHKWLQMDSKIMDNAREIVSKKGIGRNDEKDPVKCIAKLETDVKKLAETISDIEESTNQSLREMTNVLKNIQESLLRKSEKTHSYTFK